LKKNRPNARARPGTREEGFLLVQALLVTYLSWSLSAKGGAR
jgi:hypothetical protein